MFIIPSSPSSSLSYSIVTFGFGKGLFEMLVDDPNSVPLKLTFITFQFFFKLKLKTLLPIYKAILLLSLFKTKGLFNNTSDPNFELLSSR